MNKRLIDFSNPFKGRKYLKSLNAHDTFGIIFDENLNFNRNYFGFTFKTNKFGLRSKAENINSDTVICGTSYAMGLSVDNGKNWYELSENTNNAFNIGMPVGTFNHLETLKAYYTGTYKHLIYLYHPNTWVLSFNYDKARKTNRSIYDVFGWKTDLFSVIKLYFKWRLKKKIRGVNFIYKGLNYKCSSKYSYFNFEQNKDFITEQFTYMEELFSKFEKVTIVRTPIKEEISLQYIENVNLQKLEENYNQLWNAFVNQFGDKYNVQPKINHLFDLEDYLPLDTHWDESGNQKFSNYIGQFL